METAEGSVMMEVTIDHGGNIFEDDDMLNQHFDIDSDRKSSNGGGCDDWLSWQTMVVSNRDWICIL